MLENLRSTIERRAEKAWLAAYDGVLREKLRASGFRPDVYRQSYPDLAANLASDEDAETHFIRYAGDETRPFALAIDLDGLEALAALDAPTSLRVRLLVALVGAYTTAQSRLWSRDAAALAAEWSRIFEILRRVGQPYVVIGDSHSPIYGRLVRHRRAYWIPVTMICFASSASGLAAETSRSGAGARLRRYAAATAGVHVPHLFKFGQVDVEFVFDFQRVAAQETAFSEDKWLRFADATIDAYVGFLRERFAGRNASVLGLFPPALRDDVLREGYVNAHIADTEGQDSVEATRAGLRALTFADRAQRTSLHRRFNDRLARRVREAGFSFIDDFADYLAPDGLLDARFTPNHHGSDHHLEKAPATATARRVLVREIFERAW